MSCYNSDAGCNISLQSLDLFPSLKTLYLYGFSFNDSYSQTKLDGLSNLEDLHITCYSTTDCNFRLQSLDLFPSLKTLSLKGFSVNDSHSQISNLSKLEDLRISCYSTDSDCNFWLQSLDLFPSFKILFLDEINFNDSRSQTNSLNNLEDMYISCKSGGTTKIKLWLNL
ncbi:hypothetical protein ES319_A05G011000v1 [Gossypium barbadense]|uniref:Uncharacterized protein n=1 Tax=Gossypium barbadense TaxID=3634 RepID=A0A5J5VJB4_GOSBA|nr:hypothetical protein ES319_A05G011000v1 [Gossypium barbadense]